MLTIDFLQQISDDAIIASLEPVRSQIRKVINYLVRDVSDSEKKPYHNTGLTGN